MDTGNCLKVDGDRHLISSLRDAVLPCRRQPLLQESDLHLVRRKTLLERFNGIQFVWGEFNKLL